MSFRDFQEMVYPFSEFQREEAERLKKCDTHKANLEPCSECKKQDDGEEEYNNIHQNS